MSKISGLVPGLSIVVVALEICEDAHKICAGVSQSIDKMKGEHIWWWYLNFTTGWHYFTQLCDDF